MKLQKIVTNDYDSKSPINRIQTNVSAVLDYIQQSPLTGSVSLVDVAFTAIGTRQVEHKLGRKPIGWIIVDKDAVADIYSAPVTANANILITMATTQKVNCKILFF